MYSSKEYLLKVLSKNKCLDKAMLDYAASIATEKKIKKNKVLLKEGEIARRLFFITNGLIMQRFHHQNYEKAISFHFEGEFLKSYESFVKATPSAYSLQTIEDTTLLYWNKEDFQRILKEYPSGVSLMVFCTQLLLFRELKTKSKLLSHSPEELYRQLLINNHPIVQRVPLTYIADYLGISSEYLSRIRKKLKN